MVHFGKILMVFFVPAVGLILCWSHLIYAVKLHCLSSLSSNKLRITLHIFLQYIYIPEHSSVGIDAPSFLPCSGSNLPGNRFLCSALNDFCHGTLPFAKEVKSFGDVKVEMYQLYMSDKVVGQVPYELKKSLMTIWLKRSIYIFFRFRTTWSLARAVRTSFLVENIILERHVVIL